MKRYKYNSHVIIRGICLFLCVSSILVISFVTGKIHEATRSELARVFLRSEDGAIVIEWDSPDRYTCDYITIQIRDEHGIVYEEELPPRIETLSWQNGEHGKIYTVSASVYYKDGTWGQGIEKKAFFLNYDQLPDIPLIVINTRSGDDPTYEEARKPDDNLWGASLTNNEYLRGEMIMSGGGRKGVSTGVDIRIRGNTSSVGMEKKSYKIHLDDAYDLMGGGKEHSSREWVLLNNGRNLNTYIGDYVGTLCGMEWQPQMMFVNVILNGDWKGCYCLTEAVGLESAHGLVAKDGYIFENDAYWWNSDGLYFKTDNQVYELGYTFKYPEIINKDDRRVIALQNYMQEFEDRILRGDTSYQDYIDEGSYSSWILARDIMGNGDGGGTNMYFYKYDFEKSNPTSSKVKMGPLWDFDAAFMTVDQWSYCRAGNVSFFPQLFSQESFVSEYTKRWREISPGLYENVEILLDDLEKSCGEALDASWQLDSGRWGGEAASFGVQKEMALGWFSERIVWMNDSLQLSMEN